MDRVNRRAIALVGAICVLAIAVLAATAQAELVTPHAASPQLITPQAPPSAPAAPAPTAEPGGEEVEEQSLEAAASAAPAPGEPTPQLKADAQPQGRPSSDDDPDPSPKPAETLVEFGERLLSSRLLCPFYFPYLQQVRQQQQRADGERFAREAFLGFVDGNTYDQDSLLQATNAFAAIFESHPTQGFARSCLTTLMP